MGMGEETGLLSGARFLEVPGGLPKMEAALTQAGGELRGPS